MQFFYEICKVSIRRGVIPDDAGIKVSVTIP